MSVATEEARIRGLLDSIEKIESVSESLPQSDERRDQLQEAVGLLLSQIEPVRVEIAARLLDMSDKTIRAWCAQGVLTPAAEEPRLLLDPHRLHDVMHVVRDLRAAGKNRHLLDLVWFRLSDQALLDRDDLQESLAQMARGEVIPLDFTQFEQSTKDA